MSQKWHLKLKIFFLCSCWYSYTAYKITVEKMRTQKNGFKMETKCTQKQCCTLCSIISNKFLKNLKIPRIWIAYYRKKEMTWKFLEAKFYTISEFFKKILLIHLFYVKGIKLYHLLGPLKRLWSSVLVVYQKKVIEMWKKIQILWSPEN